MEMFLNEDKCYEQDAVILWIQVPELGLREG